MGSTLSHDRLLGKSAQRARCLGKISPGDIRRRFIADAKLEASRAPVNKLDRLFCFYVCHSSLNIFGDNVPAEEETTSHCQIDEKISEVMKEILPHCICPPWGRISPSGFRSRNTTGSCLEPSFARVRPSQPTKEEHRWQEGSGCGGIYTTGQVSGVIRQDNAGIRHQVGLELVEVDVERPIEAQGRRDRGYHLSNQAVEIREAWGIHAHPLFADVVDCFIVNLHQTSLPEGQIWESAHIP